MSCIKNLIYKKKKEKKKKTTFPIIQRKGVSC